MRSMLFVAAAALVLVGSSATLLIAEGKSGERPFGGPEAAPRRQVEERPFGGPPPKNRALQEFSVKCRIGESTCTLKKRQLLGTPCKCPGGNKGAGTVVE